jgi:FKBP-type peptidyl-prolyl cis-trans isomerase FkpA
VKYVFVIAAVALLAAGCDEGTPTDPSQVNIEFSATDLVVGTGAEAVAGNSVNVRYTLWLYNAAGTDSKGTELESGTFPFVLGRQQSIPGFEQGVLGMRVGGRRRIYVPSSLAYGSQGSARIPPNAALVFEVELLELVQ